MNSGSPRMAKIERNRVARPRRAFTLVELSVAAGLFSLCLGLAFRSFFYNRTAAKATDQVLRLREIRELLTEVTVSLQQAVVVETPGWAAGSAHTSILDSRYRRVRFWAQGSTGEPLFDSDDLEATGQTEDLEVYKVIEVEGKEVSRERIDHDLPIEKIRFFRLGRSLVGFRLTLKGDPQAASEKGRKGQVYSTVVALNRGVS